MSRALKDIITAYNNMDIENLSTPKQTTSSSSLVTKRPVTSSLNYKNPAVRVAKQMSVIRKYRKGMEDA